MQLYFAAGIYCLHGKLTVVWNLTSVKLTKVSFTSPELMWTQIMKLTYTKVKFYPEVKSQTGVSSLQVSCKGAFSSVWLDYMALASTRSSQLFLILIPDNSSQCLISVPPENIKKASGFFMFLGSIEREIDSEWVEMEHELEIVTLVVSTKKSAIHGRSKRANCTIILKFECCRFSCKRVLQNAK